MPQVDGGLRKRSCRWLLVSNSARAPHARKKTVPALPFTGQLAASRLKNGKVIVCMTVSMRDSSCSLRKGGFAQRAKRSLCKWRWQGRVSPTLLLIVRTGGKLESQHRGTKGEDAISKCFWGLQALGLSCGAIDAGCVDSNGSLVIVNFKHRTSWLYQVPYP